MLLINGDLSIGFIHIQIFMSTNLLLSIRVGVHIPTVNLRNVRKARLRPIYMPTNQIHLKLPTKMGKCYPNIYITDLYLGVPNEKRCLILNKLFGTKYLNVIMYINQGCPDRYDRTEKSVY